MADNALSPTTIGLFAVVGTSWGLILLAWICQRLIGFPPAPSADRAPPLASSSAAEREPLLKGSRTSQVQPGLDEANYFLFFCAILASIGMGLQSFNGNFTAVSLALDCTAPNTTTALNCQLKISEQLVSVYAAIPAVASIPGAFIGGALVDRIGRKRMMLLACVPFVAGWILTALAPTPADGTRQIDASGHAALTSKTVMLLLAGRVLLGFGGGLSIPGIGPWITESAPANLRGAFATLFQVLAVSGIAVMYVFGLLLRWRGIAVSGGVMCFVFAAFLTTLPESPRWLLARGRDAEARVALQQLRTPFSDIDAVLGTMKAEHDAEQQAAQGARGVTALMSAPSTRKAMLISMGLMTLQNLSGVNAVFLFLGDLLQPIFKTPDAANLATLPVAAGLISFTLLAAGLMDRVGRVKLLLISAIGMAASAALLGLYFHLSDPSLGWLALGAVIGYFAAFSLGVGPIPWILASELFPSASRGTANSIATMTLFIGAAITTKLLPDMKGWLGLDGLFWFYSVCCLACAAFTVTFVPETKGKSADDILRAI